MAKTREAVKSYADVGISHKLKISYFVASIIPILVMTYLYIEYISPEVDKKGESVVAVVIALLLLLTIFLSVMGLLMSNRAASESINTLKMLNSRMDTLLDLTKNFRESFYVDVLLDSIANSAKQILGAQASSILLFDESGNLRFEHTTGEMAGELKGRIVRPGEGITGWAALEGKPVIVNDASKDPRFAGKFDEGLGYKTKSIVCVPLIIDGANIGIIEVVNKKEDDFTEQDLKILYSLADHAALSIQRSKSYENTHSDFIQITEILINAMDFHVPEKKGHARRVARYAIKLAKALGLNDEEQKNIYFGALLHDIGLLKYNQDDYWGMKEFKMHPTLGYDMIKTVSMWQPMASFVFSHHERYDGGGYPRGLSGQDIPLGARIIAVAEVFDTLVSPRSYKPPISFSEAIAELRANSATQFDPHVVEMFAQTIKKEDLAE